MRLDGKYYVCVCIQGDQTQKVSQNWSKTRSPNQLPKLRYRYFCLKVNRVNSSRLQSCTKSNAVRPVDPVDPAKPDLPSQRVHGQSYHQTLLDIRAAHLRPGTFCGTSGTPCRYVRDIDTVELWKKNNPLPSTSAELFLICSTVLSA